MPYLTPSFTYNVSSLYKAYLFSGQKYPLLLFIFKKRYIYKGLSGLKISDQVLTAGQRIIESPYLYGSNL